MILSLMDQYSLDTLFQALADPTRRMVIGRLGRGAASVGELAKPFDMALPSFMKHVHMLETAGLIRTRKEGRVRYCEIDETRLAAVGSWLDEQRAIWESRTDRLERFVSEKQKEQER
jgi:DNA-binding transcriptional ArsR family regulator